MNKTSIKIWGRQFALNVIYEAYTGEEVTDFQKKAFEEFTNADEEIDTSLDALKRYLVKKNKSIFGNEIPTNVFKYVMPKAIYVSHTNKKAVVGIMCNYKFDIEHGLVVVFENGKFTKIGSEDLIL